MKVFPYGEEIIPAQAGVEKENLPHSSASFLSAAIVPQVPDPRYPMAVLNWTMLGLMTGTLHHKAAGQLIYSVQARC